MNEQSDWSKTLIFDCYQNLNNGQDNMSKIGIENIQSWEIIEKKSCESKRAHWS